eukprot:14838878-Heterocapsa_arctica.AAC.1
MYAYLMGAARALVNRRRTERQTTEFNNIYSGTTGHALAAGEAGDGKGKKGGGKGDKKDMPCFAMRDKGTCAEGKACAYSHDPPEDQGREGRLGSQEQRQEGRRQGQEGRRRQ